MDLGLIVVLLAAVAACGSPAAGHAQPGPGAGALEASVRSYSAAFLGGEAKTAYSMLSARCQTTTDYATYARLVGGANILYGHLTIKTLTVNSISPADAKVTYLYGNPNVDQHYQRWTVEGDTWKWDNC